ncbi:MAG TPA: hypothetical protein PL000_20615 [Anaerolineales bacterium]|nr:hypothetical protein [Pseudomonadales bacterium]HNC91340.1 hypothetical protein [Anaerolineales bacterium]
MSEASPQRRSWIETLSSLTPLILGLLVTGVGATFTQIYNYRQLQLNQLAALDKFRPLLTSEKPEEREFAYASFAALGYDELALKMISLKNDGAGRAVVQDISASGAGIAKVTATQILQSIPARVYLHIGEESLRPVGNAVVQALSQAGLQPMGIENISGKAGVPNQTQVRFFNDADRPVAESVASLLTAQGVKGVVTVNNQGLKAKPGTIEVWFSKEIQ